MIGTPSRDRLSVDISLLYQSLCVGQIEGGRECAGMQMPHRERLDMRGGPVEYTSRYSYFSTPRQLVPAAVHRIPAVPSADTRQLTCPVQVCIRSRDSTSRRAIPSGGKKNHGQLPSPIGSLSASFHSLFFFPLPTSKQKKNQGGTSRRSKREEIGGKEERRKKKKEGKPPDKSHNRDAERNLRPR